MERAWCRLCGRIRSDANLLVPSSLRILLWMVWGGQYGIFRDELYYLACANHPAWGYVDQPPMVVWLVSLSRWALGDSVQALRFLPAVAGACTIYLAGLLARRLGGGKTAQGLAALATLTSPILLTLSHVCTMNAYEPLLWLSLAHLALSAMERPRLWLAAGAVGGLGLLTKYSMVFALAGLGLGLLWPQTRRAFRSPWIWAGILAAILLCLPNFLWQAGHGFPFLELQANIRSHGRDFWGGPLTFLLQVTFLASPVTLPIWLAGLVHPLTGGGRAGRLLAFVGPTCLAILLVLHGKNYYAAPALPLLFALGSLPAGVWLEARRPWLRAACQTLLALGGLLILPLAMPVLSVPAFAQYTRMINPNVTRFENQKEANLPQVYADMHGWENMARTVATAFWRLPASDRARCVLFARNYGEAGALEHFGPGLGLPTVLCGHQNYWYWRPSGLSGDVMLVLGDSREGLQEVFHSVEMAAEVKSPNARPDETPLPVWVCRGLRHPLPDLWPQVRHWD